jgi:uncharacterized membrane protein YdfJ with MMPL/SSD domain
MTSSSSSAQKIVLVLASVGLLRDILSVLNRAPVPPMRWRERQVREMSGVAVSAEPWLSTLF